MLFQLVSIHPSPSPQSIPLANAFLKAYAQESPVSIVLTDFFIGQDAAACAAVIAETDPVAVGFSMYVWNRKLCCEIASLLRKCLPTCKLFCGGPEVSADPGSTLDLGIFDFVITGEGEEPFLSLCQAMTGGGDYAAIPGILLPGASILSPPSPITNLDAIPSPYLSGIIDTRSTPGLLWQLSRGCTFTCDFCFDARGIHGVRHFSLERIEAELRHFAATGVAQVFVLDSTFNTDKVRAKEILRMIRKVAPDIHFHFEVRNEFIDREMAELFAGISCSLQIGLQSADREVLKLVGRSFNKSDFTAKIGLLNESGATFGFDLIYGLPGDTLEGFCHSLDYALSLYPNHLDIFPLAVLPGTRLADRALSLKICWDRHPPYLVKSNDTFGMSEMAVAADLAAACDIFYTRGRSVAWFNAVVTLLGVKPSDLLKQFSLWLTKTRGHGINESDVSDDDIWEMQQLFLKQLFCGKKLQKYLPLVLDLAAYHHQYAAVLLSPHSDESTSSPSSRNAGFNIASSCRIMRFTYDIDELLECGEPHFRWMFANLSASGSQAVMYLHKGMVCTESLDASYIKVLENIRDHIKGNYASGTGLTSDEINEFLVFAQQEGIIVTR
ncbi:MAG: hypothetical protein A2076_18980 [Geobacteraceae bacterium GWC2_53_11]|nr:MAG: hypothetical protein A2076_18980 [Geobacteraceae bacterium GWC2_53_11]